MRHIFIHLKKKEFLNSYFENKSNQNHKINIQFPKKITEKNLMNWCKFGVNYCCNALLTLSFDNMSSVLVGY